MGIAPLVDGSLALPEAFPRAVEPFRHFMAGRTDPDTLDQLASLRDASGLSGEIARAPLSILVPSFMLSEITRAFEIGFLRITSYNVCYTKLLRSARRNDRLKSVRSLDIAAHQGP